MSKELAKYIDHTLLKPEATVKQIEVLCQEAKEHQFMSVCVNPTWVKKASELLANTDVKVCTVIGFPLGANTSTLKALEAKEAVENGAHEVDMVINIGAAKSGNWEMVYEDIKAVVEAVPENIIVKVIIETSLLTEEEKIKACEQAVKAKADFVKTSTGFSTGGATVADIHLMRQTVGATMGVKASGGVSNTKDAYDMIEAGATRIGASKGIDIINGSESKSTSDY